MAVLGIPSHKLHAEGKFFSPAKRPPRKGAAWTYRVIYAADIPDFRSIHKVYYEDGKLLYMSSYPATALAHPYTLSDDPEMRSFSLEKHMARLQEALSCPSLNESDLEREPYDSVRCRACHHALDVYSLPAKKPTNKRRGSSSD